MKYMKGVGSLSKVVNRIPNSNSNLHLIEMDKHKAFVNVNKLVNDRQH